MNEFQSFELVPLGTYSVDTYERKLELKGNSLISSVFVKSMAVGSTVKVRYWDTSVGTNYNERYDLNEHITITPAMLGPNGFTHRITVTKIHNKPVVEVIVTGGAVEFGVYGTMVSSFATDLDEALRYEGDTVDLTRDKGLAPIIYDEATGTWKFVRGNNGVQIVQVYSGDPVHLQGAGTTVASVWTSYISSTVPVGKSRRLYSVRVHTSMECEVRITNNGSNIGGGRVGGVSPNFKNNFKIPYPLAAGDILEIEARARDLSIGRAIEVYADLTEETV